MSWIDIGHIDDIPLHGARVVKTPGGCVGLFRTGPQQVFAAADRCPHKGGPLSEGIVHGHSVTCPLHNWVFDLNTGQALGADEGRIETYPLRVEAGRLLIDGTAIGKRSAA
ncbi:nitrite reductase small subunit NirD (plasmid) [Leisingera caerulea]|uniref:Nitrite reductase small subunit NirD n=1 Tax=Leisingera caerulea TaxID=506591 RepID=A0A9Q9M0I6_LEICA|nr:nitrite reductase small subunit NirD [Leisingera caerulea]UWQ56301.1 nitrite reductase small subunit NirD [Leisingera caerulea]UWQ60803.1 nitrite reductase small subunit NirD [Leisingera caerulea]UWQ65013.1 nitrite reductase small subunit NirD [Leisingera caerulea]UWQ85781.1 nitrite reductase small subunit NirD [Leisingera caerulea]